MSRRASSWAARKPIAARAYCDRPIVAYASYTINAVAMSSTPALAQEARVMARTITNDATSRGGTCRRTFRAYGLRHQYESKTTLRGQKLLSSMAVAVTLSRKPGSEKSATDTITM